MLDDVRDAFAGRKPSTFMPAPSSLYLSGEEFLRVTSIGNLASVTLRVSGFVLGSDNVKRWFSFTHGASSNRAAASTDSRLPDGWLLGLRVVASAGTPAFGQTWCELSLGIGDGASKELIQSLGYGFVTANQPIVVPSVDNLRATDGPGNLRAIVGTGPGAGAEISETVPTGARWELLAFEADLTTSAVAANRVPQLTIDDGANIFARYSVNTNETASQTWKNSFQQGVPLNADAARFVISAPLADNVRLGPGHRIRTVTAAIDAGDSWGTPKYLVREFFDV